MHQCSQSIQFHNLVLMQIGQDYSSCFIFLNSRMHTHIYTHTHAHTYMHTYTHKHTHAHAYTQSYQSLSKFMQIHASIGHGGDGSPLQPVSGERSPHTHTHSH